MGNNEPGNQKDSSSGKKPAFHISKDPVVHGKPEDDVHKYEATIGDHSYGAPEHRQYEELGSLPASYGSRSFFLVARDPSWLYSYWDLDWSEYPSSRLGAGKVTLKVFNADGGEVYVSEIDPEARNWYIPVNRGNAAFYAELGFINPAGAWEVIVRSNDTTTPSDSISEQVADAFATVPYHLAFEKLMDLVRGTIGHGETLMEALARLQQDSRQWLFQPGAVPNWSDAQRRVLAALLGLDDSELAGLTAAELDQLLRKKLQARLFSESSSELSVSGAGGESSLSSAFGPFRAVSSWTESSWTGASWEFSSYGLSSWTSESKFWSSWLSSYSGGVSAQSSFWSSWLSSFPVGPGAAESSFWSSWLSSWPAAVSVTQSSFWSSWLTSWPAGVSSMQSSFWSSYLSSWPAGVSSMQSSFWSSYLSSWPAGVSSMQSSFWSSYLSSWPAGVSSIQSSFWSSYLSSWPAGVSSMQSSFWSSWLSSWPAGASSMQSSFWSSWLSSWPTAAGASESNFWSSWLTSWSGAAGASWSAQPFSKPREFYMHVNAEVIFYGGTHPDAKVWIDGQEVTLNQDGSFRFHFKFPDGNYEIPILAQSPDGVESRSATLRFERNTHRRGDVRSTAQPEYLASEPMGRR